MELPVTEYECNDCRYWVPMQTQDGHTRPEGHCRRFPPVKADDKEDEPWRFPVTLYDSSCGEWPD